MKKFWAAVAAVVLGSAVSASAMTVTKFTGENTFFSA